MQYKNIAPSFSLVSSFALLCVLRVHAFFAFMLFSAGAKIGWRQGKRDLQSGKPRAVDSWCYANGERPAIVPLDEWKRGWEPHET
jgi:hypothetical protein